MLKVKHINSDASFLLTFTPILPFPPSAAEDTKSFTILLDPWITGTSKIWHPKFSISRQKHASCISSLMELPEPDLVVISQDKSDHCHKETLTQLPRNGGKTRILAEPQAAKIIKGWKHFDAEKVVALPRWEASRKTSAIYRIPVPPLLEGGVPGEVTVTFLAQKKDVTGLHSAIAITYRPPLLTQSPGRFPWTPPDSPLSTQSAFSDSVTDRALSVIFSPHGCSYKTLAPFVTSHLVAEAALPLTCLLHCFDRVQNVWYMGGNICSGLQGGAPIAQNLRAQAWISTHDGLKETTGFANNKIVIEKTPREQVESVVSPMSEKFPGRRVGTEAVVLQAGEELVLNRMMGNGYGESDDGNEWETIMNMKRTY